MHKIKRLVNGHGIVGLTEILFNAIDFDIDTHEVFTGKDKLFQKGYRGLAFIVRRSLKY